MHLPYLRNIGRRLRPLPQQDSEKLNHSHHNSVVQQNP
jgi:hypothetical protein